VSPPAAAARLGELWYGRSPLALPLLPLSWLYRLGVGIRRGAYRTGLRHVHCLPVPVVVVGNLTVGGTGKTPLVIWLAEYLSEVGWRPGIVTRGYGGRASRWPQQVRPDADPIVVGDEAVVIARRSRCPVAAGPERVEAAAALIELHGCNVIISDDGLQHYALARDCEICVLDGVRRFGNGWLLPAGPLREPLSRLAQVDLLVTRGIAARGEFPMRYRAQALVQIGGDARRFAVEEFPAREVHAVAAIGHPEAFFSQLRGLGFRLHEHAYPDHHVFTAAQIHFDDPLPVIMTEKDAVKCGRLAGPQHWYLPITAELPEVFERRLDALLQRRKDG